MTVTSAFAGEPRWRQTTSGTGPATLNAPPARPDPLRRLAERLTVRLVTGSLPDELCGVGAYTGRLAAALAELGVDVQLVKQTGADRLGKVVASQPDNAIVHLQYPTIGVGASVAPLSGVLRRAGMVVTLHEFSHVHPLRRAMAVALANGADQVVVSNELERGRVQRWLKPFHTAPLAVLPIPTNIPVGMVARPRPLNATWSSEDSERPFTVGYFGIVRPDGALQRFLDLAEHAQQHRVHVRFVVIGGCHEKHRAAIKALQGRHERLPIRWTGRLEDDAVSRELAGLDAAYLPFTDGVSERRTSALAVLAHGIPLITSIGPATTASLRSCVVAADGPASAWQQLGSLDADDVGRLGRAGVAFAEARSTHRLAEQHVALYQAVLRRRAQRSRVE